MIFNTCIDIGVVVYLHDIAGLADLFYVYSVKTISDKVTALRASLN